MGKKLNVIVGVIVVVVVIILVLKITGKLDPIISRNITKEPYLSVSETHEKDLWLRAEIHIHVTNDGGASASGAAVTVGSTGDSKVESLGSIAVGETKSADFTFWLARGGDYVFTATATCVGGYSDIYTFTVHVNGF